MEVDTDSEPPVHLAVLHVYDPANVHIWQDILGNPAEVLYLSHVSLSPLFEEIELLQLLLVLELQGLVLLHLLLVL